MAEDIILQVSNIKKYFPLSGWFMGKSSESIKALDGVDSK